MVAVRLEMRGRGRYEVVAQHRETFEVLVRTGNMKYSEAMEVRDYLRKLFAEYEYSAPLERQRPKCVHV